jgi:hypothetical protein
MAPLPVKMAATRCYPAHTAKKRMIRRILGACVAARVDRVWPSTATPVPTISADALDEWLSRITSLLGVNRVHPVVVWPANPSRGRIYLHVLDEHGDKLAFVKVALDERNSHLIENEHRALAALAPMHLHLTRVPRILDSGDFDGKTWLAVEPTSDAVRFADWQSGLDLDQNVREFAGPVRFEPFNGLQEHQWWCQFWSLRDEVPAPFADQVQQAAEGGADVRRVHGDLNQTNIVQEASVLWILDWEQSSEAGPAMTDFVCIDVDKRWPVTKRDAAASLREFLRVQFHSRAPAHQKDVLLALAFLVAARFTPAIALIRNWPTAASLR